MSNPNKHSILQEKTIELYCIYNQIKNFKEEISILRESITDLEEEKNMLQSIIIHELKARDLNTYSYKDMNMKIILKPFRESLSRDEKERKIADLVEDNSLNLDEKIKNIFAIMKPQETGINTEQISIKMNKKSQSATISRNETD